MVSVRRTGMAAAIVVLSALPLALPAGGSLAAPRGHGAEPYPAIEPVARNGEGHRMENRHEDLVSRDQAARIARSASGGRVLRVRLHGGSHPRYRVKVLVDGERVRAIHIDARSGRILD